MKKFTSLFLALALCMGLAVPVFAAELKSDKYTYTLSNEPMAAERVFNEPQYDDDGNFIEMKEVTRTVYLVSDGTTVTIADESCAISGSYFFPAGDNEGGPIYGDGSSSYTLTGVDWGSDVEKVAFNIGSIPKGDEVFAPDDEGIWLMIAPNAAATKLTTPVEPEQPTEPATPDKPGTYTVKKGDIWPTICTNFCGDNAQRYKLMKVNKNVKLADGEVITLPEKLGKDTLIPAAVANEGETLYTVQYGDTLGASAKAHYGNVMQYKAIYERNADRLVNANTIYEGQVIVLPTK